MATVIRDNLWLCDDCSIAACNADFSAIDNPERENTIRHGLAMLGKEGYPVANNDSETGRYSGVLAHYVRLLRHQAARLAFAVLSAHAHLTRPLRPSSPLAAGWPDATSKEDAMTEFVAQLLWVAIGEYYEAHWPFCDTEYRALDSAQSQLGWVIWGVPW